MHTAAYSFVRSAVAELGPFASVVEIGSRDLNGSVRELFATPAYVGLDVVAGPGVDVVIDLDGPPWAPAELVDAVVSCEVLEHVADWSTILAEAASYLRLGGRLILTAAGPGRREHSGITGRRVLEPGEHYANVDPDDLARALEAAGFDEIRVDVDGNDVRATARRAPGLVVAVLFRDLLPATRYVAELALDDPAVGLLVLVDNGSTTKTVDTWLRKLEGNPRVKIEHRPPLSAETSIYRVWNDQIDTAQALGANLAIVNNDVRLAPGSFSHLARALRNAPPEVAAVYPDWNRALADGVDVTGELTPTRGAWRAGGLSGFAFVVRAALVAPAGPLERFDERYAWIFGDGDFVEDLERAGYTAARVEGLPLEHDKSTTAKASSWTAAAKKADVARREAKVEERGPS